MGVEWEAGTSEGSRKIVNRLRPPKEKMPRMRSAEVSKTGAAEALGELCWGKSGAFHELFLFGFPCS